MSGKSKGKEDKDHGAKGQWRCIQGCDLSHYIFFSVSRHKHGSVWPGFAEVSRLPPPSHNPQLYKYRPEMLLLLKNHPGKLLIALLSGGFTALLGKVKENIQYMSIEKEKNHCPAVISPHTGAFWRTHPISAARAHTQIHLLLSGR